MRCVVGCAVGCAANRQRSEGRQLTIHRGAAGGRQADRQRLAGGQSAGRQRLAGGQAAGRQRLAGGQRSAAAGGRGSTQPAALAVAAAAGHLLAAWGAGRLMAAGGGAALLVGWGELCAFPSGVPRVSVSAPAAPCSCRLAGEAVAPGLWPLNGAPAPPACRPCARARLARPSPARAPSRSVLASPAASAATAPAAISYQKHQSRQQQPRHYSRPRAGARPRAAYCAPWAAYRAPRAAHRIAQLSQSDRHKKRPTSALVSLPVLSWYSSNLVIAVILAARIGQRMS